MKKTKKSTKKVSKKPVKKAVKKPVKKVVKKAVKNVVSKKTVKKVPAKLVKAVKKKDQAPAHVTRIYQICDDMKATDIVVLDMQGTSSFTDYVIIASSSNTRQVVSIADKISMDLKREFGKYAIGVEGKVGGQWVLIDYGDVVCHLFLEETREFYRLEKLWHDAKTLKL